MREVLTTSADVMDALGGNKAVQELTAAQSPQVVSNWRTSNKFPSRYHALMKAELERLGKSAPASLWGQATREQTAQEQGVRS